MHIRIIGRSSRQFDRRDDLRYKLRTPVKFDNQILIILERIILNGRKHTLIRSQHKSFRLIRIVGGSGSIRPHHFGFRRGKFDTVGCDGEFIHGTGFHFERKSLFVEQCISRSSGYCLSDQRSFRLGNSECKRLSIDGIQLLATRITEGKFRRRRYQRRQIHGPIISFGSLCERQDRFTVLIHDRISGQHAMNLFVRIFYFGSHLVGIFDVFALILGIGPGQHEIRHRDLNTRFGIGGSDKSRRKVRFEIVRFAFAQRRTIDMESDHLRLAGLFCGNIIVIRRSDNGKFAGRFIDVLDLFDRKTGCRTRSDLFGYERHGLRIGIFFHSTGRRHTESQSRYLLAFRTGTQIKIPVLGFVRNFVLTGQHDILLPVAEIDQTVHIIRQVNDRLDTTTEQTDIGLQRRQVILKFLVELVFGNHERTVVFPDQSLDLFSQRTGLLVQFLHNRCDRLRGNLPQQVVAQCHLVHINCQFIAQPFIDRAAGRLEFGLDSIGDPLRGGGFDLAHLTVGQLSTGSLETIVRQVRFDELRHFERKTCGILFEFNHIFQRFLNALQCFLGSVNTRYFFQNTRFQTVQVLLQGPVGE